MCLIVKDCYEPPVGGLFPYVSEKVGGAEGTKLDDEFTDLEKKYDVINKAVSDVMTKTQEYLQPNLGNRMMMTVSKMRGQGKSPGYPQPEGILGDAMLKYGDEMGNNSSFGKAMAEVGEGMKKLAEVKDSLDINVQHNVLEPLQALQEKELKDIGQNLKKLESRRLDFDFKKKRQGKVPEEEVTAAEDKFKESYEVTSEALYNLIDSEVEQVSQLRSLVDAQLEYHQNAVTILQELQCCMQRRVEDSSQSKSKRTTVKDRNSWDTFTEPASFGPWGSSACKTSNSKQQGFGTSFKPKETMGTCCALYDFDAENNGELTFKEDDVITLIRKVDENWFEGSLGGQKGLFPCNYVEVQKPLPH
uniref:SH3 domain containing GRB2 like 1, endophilin A2 n=1 Tax=Eptatretus burgeri TaxID=7764 RepID=A0A8C4R9Y6_EPTBU